jgi:hypothetical protein
MLRWRTEQTNGIGTNGHCKKKKVNTDLTSFTKVNSEWNININIKCKTIKHLVDNIEKSKWPWVWWWPFRHNAKSMSHERKY